MIYEKMKPVVEIDFDWNFNLLWQEYKRLQLEPQPNYEFLVDGKPRHNTLQGIKVYGSQEYGEDTDSLLMQEAKRFCKHFGITDDILAQYLWLEKDFYLKWHIDDITRCTSSVNVIMTEDPAPVSFREGEFKYNCAALDVMKEHSVTNNKNQRVLMRISFRNLSHRDLVNNYISKRKIVDV
jgi:hypothetical protein